MTANGWGSSRAGLYALHFLQALKIVTSRKTFRYRFSRHGYYTMLCFRAFLLFYRSSVNLRCPPSPSRIILISVESLMSLALFSILEM